MFGSQVEYHLERTLAMSQKDKSEWAFYWALGSGLKWFNAGLSSEGANWNWKVDMLA